MRPAIAATAGAVQRPWLDGFGQYYRANFRGSEVVEASSRRLFSTQSIDALAEVRLDLDFDTHAAKDPAVLQDVLRKDLAEGLGVSEDRIVIEGVRPGSIIIDFRIKAATVEDASALQDLCAGRSTRPAFTTLARTVGVPVA